MVGLLPGEVEVIGGGVVGVVGGYSLLSFLAGSVGFIMSLGLFMLRDWLSVFSFLLGFTFGLMFYWIL